GTKKTASDASAARFITRNVRAGEVRRFRGEAAGTRALQGARRSHAAPPVNRVVRSQDGGSTKAEMKNARISHGRRRRSNLWERKWNLIRLRPVNSSGKRAWTCQSPASVRKRRRNSVPAMAG